MRHNLATLLALAPLAGLVSGCAMGTMGSAAAGSVSPVSLVRTIKGKAYGGQLPVTGAVIAVYTYGTSGYGSTGTVLATSTTDSNGDFNFTFTCPTATTPVYALSIGGNAGFGTNTAIVEGAGLGTCASADAASFLTINEITTAVLAFSLPHFFNAGVTDGTATDHFGSPGTVSAAVGRVNNTLIPTILDTVNGYPKVSTATFTNESSKIVTLGNILANCVNTGGPTSTGCATLFSLTTPTGGTAPKNVLEAAVSMALHPMLNVPQLYNLSGSTAFSGGLTGSAPPDWTLAVSYTAPTMGLGINTRTVSTVDIDTSGRVWFPTNATGATGVAYFDPSASAFSSVYTTPGLVRPEQVAIDVDNYVWVSDVSSAIVAGFPASSPSSPVALTLPNTTSTALTVMQDNTLRVAISNNGTLYPALAQITGKNSYTLVPNSTIMSGGFIGSSLAGDTTGGLAAQGTNLGNPYTYDIYITPTFQITPVITQPNADAGQVVFTGNNYVSVRGGYVTNTPAGQTDGLCIYTMTNCYQMQNETVLRHPSGLSIDGLGNLWLADEYAPSVEEIPLTNASYLDSNSVPNNLVYVHGTNNGGTMQNPTGIAVDNTGNVWTTNIGCYGNGCTPAALVLSELIGAAGPTITPVSRQLDINGSLPGTLP